VWGYTSTHPICLHDVVLSKSTGTTLPLPFTFKYYLAGDLDSELFLKY